MHRKKLIAIAGVILLIGAAVIAVPALAKTEAAFNWYSNTTDFVGQFQNTGTGNGVWGNATGSGTIGTYGWNTGSGAMGVRGYATNGYGVWGRSVYYVGVRGEGGTGSGDYGGYFTGYDGIRGVTSASVGYGTWGSAYGSSGVGAYGYANGTYGYGAYGYSYNYIGVRGVGDEFGGYFNGDIGAYGFGTIRGLYGVSTASAGEGVRGYTTGSGGDGVTATATNSYGYGVDAYASGPSGFGIRAVGAGTSGYGGFFASAQYRGIYADGATNYFDAVFPNTLYVGGYVYGSWGVAVIARNDGAETLATGDLVSFTSFDASAAGSGAPALAVAKADQGGGAAIVGVVQGAYVLEPSVAVEGLLSGDLGTETRQIDIGIPAQAPQKDVSPLPAGAVPDEEEAADPMLGEALQGTVEFMAPEVVAPASEPVMSNGVNDLLAGHLAEGDIATGQYALIVIQGFAKIQVDTSGPVNAGDWVMASPQGSVSTVSDRRYSRALNSGYASIGRAMESLDESGMVYVYVNFR